METLKILSEIIKDLPATAVWVIIIFFIYKVFIVGSVYGVIRFGFKTLQNIMTKPREYKFKNGSFISEDVAEELREVISNYMTKEMSNGGRSYFHSSDVNKLRKKLAEKES